MADQTIHDESVVTTAAVGDEVLIWRVANNDTKRITKANFMGVTITGGGTIATGGFTLTVGGPSTVNGSLVGNISGAGTIATGGFTLTVPATGTAAILAGAQTFSGLKTFSDGFKIGTASLTAMEMGSWTPTIVSSNGGGGAPAVGYTTQDGYYQRWNTMVQFYCFIQISTIVGGTGNMRIGGLPYTVGSAQQPRCFTAIDQIDVPGTAPFVMVTFGVAGTTTMGPVVLNDNASFSTMPLSLLGNGDSIAVTGFYMM